MAETTNPFESPVETPAKEFYEYRVSDKQIASREVYQAFVAGAFTLFFLVVWAYFHSFPGGPPLPVDIVLVILSLSSAATTLNHRMRAKRAYQHLPLEIDERGICGKVEHKNEWDLREFPWEIIQSVQVDGSKIKVTTRDSQVHIIDARILRSTRIRMIEKTIAHYTDRMHEEVPTGA